MTESQKPLERPILALATEEKRFGKSVRVRERPAGEAEAEPAAQINLTHRLLEETSELPAHVDPRTAHQRSFLSGCSTAETSILSIYQNLLDS